MPVNGFTVGELFGGHKSKSGQNVNNSNALTISSAWRAINILGGAVSSIPCQPFRKTKTGREQLTEHPIHNILTRRVNKKYTTKLWFDRVINHLHLRGNHYALPIYNTLGQVVELELLNPDHVTIFETKNDIIYKIQGVEKQYRSDEIIHVPHLGDGIMGVSTISKAKEDFGLEMSRRDYGSDVYAGGGQVQGVLSPRTPIKDEQRKVAAKAFQEAKRTSKDIVLPFGFDYTKMAFNPSEVEFLESGNFSVSTIARWFGVPPHKLYDLDRATFSNIEHMAIEFLQDTIAPILNKIEAEYSTKIFQLYSERKNYIEFNMDAYIRADSKTKAESIATQINSAQLMPSEAREMSNKPFIEGSDRLFIQMGTGPLDIIDKVLLKNQLTPAKKEALKALFNGRTQEILDILE